METLLDALQEGRLFELPHNDKMLCLQFLAHVIEAFPEVPPGTDVVGLVTAREQEANTGLGKGWACPHAHVAFDEDLKCVIGWSPTGIDYGAPDGQPVFIIVMYLIPDNQRSFYLREISLLARTLQNYPHVDAIRQARDLDAIRNYLLDLIEFNKEAGATDTRARMIRLQAKTPIPQPAFRDLTDLVVEPVTVVAGPDHPPVILTQDPDLYATLSAATDLVEKLETSGAYQHGPWRILRRTTLNYRGGWATYDCIAVTLAHHTPTPPPPPPK